MSFVPIDSAIEFDGQVHNQSTGALIAADSTPTWKVYQQGNTTAIATGNMTARATAGEYFMATTALGASGFTAGKMHQVKMTAAVSGITDITVLGRFFCVPAWSVAGVMKVDVSHWIGTAVALVGGLPSVNMTTVTAGIIAATSFAANALDAVWSAASRVLTGTTLTSANTELTAVPAATASLTSMIKWMFMQSRNRLAQTATEQTLLADDAVTPVATATVSDDGTTAVRGEFV